MKVFSLVFAVAVATSLLGCPGEEKKDPGAASTAAATSSAQTKPAAAPKPSGTGGW